MLSSFPVCGTINSNLIFFRQPNTPVQESKNLGQVKGGNYLLGASNVRIVQLVLPWTPKDVPLGLGTLRDHIRKPTGKMGAILVGILGTFSVWGVDIGVPYFTKNGFPVAGSALAFFGTSKSFPGKLTCLGPIAVWWSKPQTPELLTWTST